MTKRNKECTEPTCNGEDCYRFNCWDCNVNTLHINEYYMVDNGLWESATEDCGKDVMLCIGCLENRLGGPLTSTDFPPLPINRGVFGYSERLMNRLMTVA